MNKGVSLYLVIIVLALILAIVFGVTTILIKQLKITRGMEDSMMAYYAAEAGIEEGLRALIKLGGVDLPGYPYTSTGSLGDATYTLRIDMYDSSNFRVRSKGNYKGTERALEVNFGEINADVIEYDYFSCSPVNQNFNSYKELDTAYNGWAQMFLANQDYSPSSVELIMGKWSSSGMPGNIIVSIQELDNAFHFGLGCWDVPYDGSHIFDYPDGNKICEATIDANSLAVTPTNVLVAWDGVCSLNSGTYYFLVIESESNIDNDDDAVSIKYGKIADDTICNIIEGSCDGDFIGRRIGIGWSCRPDCYDETEKNSIFFNLWRF